MAPRRISGRDPANGAQTTVTIEHGRIASIDSAKSLEQAWLSPGLVDLQVNGFGGHDVNVPDLTADAIAALARAVAARGATTFLPTIVTTSPERIDRALVTIAEARREDALSRRAIPCVHVEGPSISPEDGPRGAHPREWTRPPDLSEFHAWQSASGDLVGLVTLSPHWPGAPDYIRALVARGVRVAIGHTHADAEQIAAAADAGATLSTHLGNGAHAMLPRHPNYLWAQLANERFAASFIADGHHLPTDTLKAMMRAKGIDRSILVSDSVALAGMPPGRYETPVGGHVNLSPDGRLSMEGGPYLAGAAKPLIDGVAHVAQIEGFSLGDAIAMASRNPGAYIGERGALRLGDSADLLRFHWRQGDARLQIDTVLSEGVEVG